MKKKVLILCPPFSDPGGVAYYYSMIKKNMISENISVEFYHTGKNYNSANKERRVLKSIKDMKALIKQFTFYDLIIINPSLDSKAIIRDGMYNFVAKKILKRKTMIFIHGWNEGVEKYIDRFGSKIFRYFFCSNQVYVLASSFKKKLIKWGFSPEKVKMETTVYEYKNYDIKKDPHKFVFLSRFSPNKGCVEAIQTIEKLRLDYPGIKLFMSGDGVLKQELQDYVENHDLSSNVEFVGYLRGDEKYKLLERCGVMIYPTQYGEGMPISILEGMGMGCVVITRPIAGIKDIIKDGENGFLIRSVKPKDFALKAKYLLQNLDVWREISNKSREIAKDRFEAKNVTKRFEHILIETAA